MIAGWLLLLVSLGYVAGLFAVAYYGDRRPLYPNRAWLRPLVYSLALAVYCSSWTFYGAVGSSAGSSLSYLPIYLGPILLFTFGSGTAESSTTEWVDNASFDPEVHGNPLSATPATMATTFVADAGGVAGNVAAFTIQHDAAVALAQELESDAVRDRLGRLPRDGHVVAGRKGLDCDRHVSLQAPAPQIAANSS